MRGVVAAAVAHASTARIMHSALLDGCGLPKRQYRKRKQLPECDISEACLPKHRDTHLRKDGRSSVVSCFGKGHCDCHVV